MSEKRSDIERRQKVDELLAMSDDIKRLVSVLQDIEGFLTILATIGRVLKWVAGIATAAFTAYAAYKGLTHK